jgi:low temperature requirement protein LtrA
MADTPYADGLILEGDPEAAGGRRVSPLELFLDLVFVFAITQVTTFLARDPTWPGLLRGLLILSVLWWAWSSYAWLTNALDPEEGLVRLVVLAAIAAMLILALAAPRAFAEAGVVFGGAYLVVRLLHLALVAVAKRGGADRWRAFLSVLPGAIVAPAFLIVAGLVQDPARIALWGAAIAVLYLAPIVGRMRGFTVSPEHFVERFELIIIIAVGESIAALGLGALGLPLDAGVIGATLLGMTVAACLWWSYFDWVFYVTQARLVEMTGSDRAKFARDAYSYLHLPMVGGIVLFAFGLKVTLPHIGAHLELVPAAGLSGGVALYFLAHVGLRLRIGGGFGRGRPIAALVLLASVPFVTVVPAVAALGFVAIAGVALITYEVVRHREDRAWIRQRRDGFTFEEARAQLERRNAEGSGGGPL